MVTTCRFAHSIYTNVIGIWPTWSSVHNLFLERVICTCTMYPAVQFTPLVRANCNDESTELLDLLHTGKTEICIQTLNIWESAVSLLVMSYCYIHSQGYSEGGHIQQTGKYVGRTHCSLFSGPITTHETAETLNTSYSCFHRNLLATEQELGV